MKEYNWKFKLDTKWIVTDVLLFVFLAFSVEYLFKTLEWNWSSGSFIAGYFLYLLLETVHPIPDNLTK